MSMIEKKVTFTGTSPLLLNNPQMVDRFNKHAKAAALITAKGKRRTDDDYLEMRDIEMRAKVYWNDDLGIYVPTTWLTSALNSNSFKHYKISKADMRSAVFCKAAVSRLKYEGRNAVKKVTDIVNNEHYRHMMLLKQGQVKIAKVFPIFHKWDFDVEFVFDSGVVDEATIDDMLMRVGRYGGFGDFRPTFGLCDVSVS